MVHVTDMFTTLLSMTGCKAPADRLIDGVDQSPFFLGKQETSNRESCIVWLKDELHAVKWKDFKINFKRQQHFHDPELALGFARITHLKEDPKERDAVNQRYVRWWVMQHAQRIIRDFEESAKKEELIPPRRRARFRAQATRQGLNAMTAPTRAETIAHGAAGNRRGQGCCSASGHVNAGLAPDTIKLESMNWIPGGAFLMGSNSFYREERPVRPEFVEGFWIDVFPVTNAEFREFVEATGYVTYSERPPNPAMYPDADPALLVPGSLVFVKPDRPVSLRNNLAWWEYRPARTGGIRRGRKVRLPAVTIIPSCTSPTRTRSPMRRGATRSCRPKRNRSSPPVGGLEGKAYPWGDAANPEGRFLANTWQGQFPHENLAEDGYDGTSPVDAFPANGYGLFDMVGNVWEWTSSPYDAVPDQPPQSCCHPNAGDDRSTRRVVKGGSHLCAPNYCLRYRPSARQGETVNSSTCHIGFRCVVRRPTGRLTQASRQT